MLTALCYMSSTIFNYFGYNIEPLSNFGGMSLLTWLFIYLASIVFNFCAYHRMFLWYIFIGITLFTVLILYVKDNKVIIRKSNK